MGYPVIYWVVVVIVAGAVSTVLIGIGYLLGLKIAARRVATVRAELEQAKANHWAVYGSYETRGRELAQWGGR